MRVAAAHGGPSAERLARRRLTESLRDDELYVAAYRRPIQRH
jgi:hypothetical protein